MNEKEDGSSLCRLRHLSEGLKRMSLFMGSLNNGLLGLLSK